MGPGGAEKYSELFAVAFFGHFTNYATDGFTMRAFAVLETRGGWDLCWAWSLGGWARWEPRQRRTGVPLTAVLRSDELRGACKRAHCFQG